MEIGKCYLVQTVTHYWLGRVVEMGPHSVTLEEASWVVDTGRMHEFMQKGKAQGMEIEPVGVVCCQWLAWLPWPHPLLTDVV